MAHFTITGMTCAACAARVEKAIAAVPGVDQVSVNLLTNTAAVSGDAPDSAVIDAVRRAGYGAMLPTASRSASSPDNTETASLARRLVLSLILLVPLMAVSMGHLPLPQILTDTPLTLALIQFILSGIILIINRHFFIHGFGALVHRAPTMDSLVALGSSASFMWSTALTVMPHSDVSQHLRELYFDSAAMILTLITVGKLLEARAKGKTTNALRSLMDLAPKNATILQDEREVTIPAAQVKVGDLFVVRPGESFPVDGIVLEGTSAVNESSLTGESTPVDKTPGDTVSAATLNQSGFLRCRATGVGEDTALARIIRLVSDAAATKAPIARLADKVSGIFVPIVLAIALITAITWYFLDAPPAVILARAIAVLVVSCPCALGLATPVAIMVGSGLGARHGLLFKHAAALELTGRIKAIALDKTGTLTSGHPQVTDIVPADGVPPEHLLDIALALESHSEHPLGKAIVDYAQERAILPLSDFFAHPGKGLSGKLNGTTLYGGSMAFVGSHLPLSQDFVHQADRFATEGKTPIAFAEDATPLGIIAVADTLKSDASAAIQDLKALGLRITMLTGDNHRTARAIAEQAGLQDVIAEVLPDGKADAIKKIQRSSPVAMVGDGINDAPALTQADIGIAIGAGTDIALDAADVVLVNNNLEDIPAAIRLSRATLRTIRQNLFWAFFYNVIGIPIAAGCLTHWGITLNPMICAAAMSLSSFCVVSNALRLNLCKLYNNKEKPKMQTVTMLVKGMMCPHCEAHVKSALEAIPGVDSAAASHVKGEVAVTLNAPVEEAVLKEAIVKSGYECVGVKR